MEKSYAGQYNSGKLYKKLEWYVGDSKREELIRYLDKIGFRNSENDTTSSDASL